MNSRGALRRGEEGVIDIAFSGTAIEGFAVWDIELCANSHAFDQIWIGDKRPAEGDEIGSLCVYGLLGKGNVIAVVGDVEALEGAA